jgi:hypothetical protein
MASKMFWNREKTKSVVISKIKEFTICQNTYNNKYSVRGWYNKENFFVFGDDFETLPQAQKFLEDIHARM